MGWAGKAGWAAGWWSRWSWFLLRGSEWLERTGGGVGGVACVVSCGVCVCVCVCGGGEHGIPWDAYLHVCMAVSTRKGAWGQWRHSRRRTAGGLNRARTQSFPVGRDVDVVCSAWCARGARGGGVVCEVDTVTAGSESVDQHALDLPLGRLGGLFCTCCFLHARNKGWLVVWGCWRARGATKACVQGAPKDMGQAVPRFLARRCPEEEKERHDDAALLVPARSTPHTLPTPTPTSTMPLPPLTLAAPAACSPFPPQYPPPPQHTQASHTSHLLLKP